MVSESNPARVLESIVLLFIIWRKLSPHLTRIEGRIGGLESAVRDGFALGEGRFKKIEDDVKDLKTDVVSLKLKAQT